MRKAAHTIHVMLFRTLLGHVQGTCKYRNVLEYIDCLEHVATSFLLSTVLCVQYQLHLFNMYSETWSSSVVEGWKAVRLP